MVSKKSGQVYERRLIVKYIEDNGKDPVTGEDLSVDDLLDIKSSKSLSLSSSVFQCHSGRRKGSLLKHSYCCFLELTLRIK